MGFIEHKQSAAGLLDEERGIGLGDSQRCWVVEGDVVGVRGARRNDLGEGALSHLSRALDHHHRCIGEGVAHRCLQESRVGFVAVHKSSQSHACRKKAVNLQI